MQWITRIQIRHFRSINEIDIKDLSDHNVFSGRNDVGKSNIVKALNLFFNGRVDWRTEFSLTDDTNLHHAHYASFARKKRHVQIIVHFKPKKGRYSTLPEEFWVSREWNNANPTIPELTWGTGSETKPDHPSSLTRFLNSCRFFYVPAVRERDFQQQLLRTLLVRLNETSVNTEIADVSKRLDEVFQKQASSLMASLKETTGLNISIRLPQSIIGLLEAAGLITDEQLPLTVRGDGVQVLSITGLIDYLGEDSDHNFWGFEEPENSLEMRKAHELALRLQNHYSKRAQIFTTSHSPSFVALENSRTSVFAVVMSSEEYNSRSFRNSTVKPIAIRGRVLDTDHLADELGYIDVLRSVDRDYQAKLTEIDRHSAEIKNLREQLAAYTEPLVYVEGPHDARVLEKVWQRLYTGRMPFLVKPAGGASKLADALGVTAQFGRVKAFGIFDCDQEGISGLQKLGSNYSFREIRNSNPSRFEKDDVVAILLPIPPGREICKQHRNMPLEFYFPDTALTKVDSGHELFSREIYILNGRPTQVGVDSLQTLRAQGNVSLQQLQVKEPGKTILVDFVAKADRNDLVAFKPLFDLIHEHFELQVVEKS